MYFDKYTNTRLPLIMQIQELFPKDSLNQQLGYDLKEDLMCFMTHDPEFYRKEYFPVMHKFKQYVESGRQVQSRAFKSLVEKAYNQYQKKFPVEGLESDLPKDVCEEVCNHIHEQETKHIKDGHYDDEN